MLSSTSSIVQLAKAPFKRAQRGLFGGTCSILYPTSTDSHISDKLQLEKAYSGTVTRTVMGDKGSGGNGPTGMDKNITNRVRFFSVATEKSTPRRRT